MPARGNAFPAIRKTDRIVTCFYIDCPNTQPVFICEHFVDLLSSYPLGRSLESSSEEGITLFGVGEILATEDLEFPVLLNKIVDDMHIIVERGPKDGKEHA